MRKLTEEQIDVIALDYKSGMSIRDIVIKTGRSSGTVSRALEKRDIVRSKNRFSAETEQQIVQHYIDGLSMNELAKRFESVAKTISNIVKRHGVKRRPRGNTLRQLTQLESKTIAELWKQGKARRHISKTLGVNLAIVNRELKQMGEVPSDRIPMGDKHPFWKGGVRVNNYGYRHVLLRREDPYYSMTNGVGYCPEHRLVMAKWLGRCLLKSETVHHRNGDRSDNRIENLQLILGNHGKGQVYCCAECGSHKLTPLNIDRS